MMLVMFSNDNAMKLEVEKKMIVKFFFNVSESVLLGYNS